MKFPTLIEWLEETGIDNLRKDMESTGNSSCGITKYCQIQYESQQNAWEVRMNVNKTINVPMNEDNDIAFETAKIVFQYLVNEARHNVPVVIQKEDLAPCYVSALSVVDEYCYNLLPKLEEFLKNVKD